MIEALYRDSPAVLSQVAHDQWMGAVGGTLG